MGETIPTSEQRVVWVDWMRVAACFMVMVVHATEPFYLGGQGSLILSEAEGFWAAFFDTVVRCCVPLFIITSSYLQFPLHYPTGEFFRRRAVRILVPFLVWSVVYALYWGEPVENFQNLLLNFNYSAGHLWFVYMLVGVYLLMPLLSPWAERVSKRELQVYLGIWLFTTLIPLMRDWFAGGAPTVIYGPSGLPRGELECIRHLLLPEWLYRLYAVGSLFPQVCQRAVVAQEPGCGSADLCCGLCHLFWRLSAQSHRVGRRCISRGGTGRGGRMVGDHMV